MYIQISVREIWVTYGEERPSVCDFAYIVMGVCLFYILSCVRVFLALTVADDRDDDKFGYVRFCWASSVCVEYLSSASRY